MFIDANQEADFEGKNSAYRQSYDLNQTEESFQVMTPSLPQVAVAHPKQEKTNYGFNFDENTNRSQINKNIIRLRNQEINPKVYHLDPKLLKK